MTFVDRATRCIVGWRVSTDLLQALADDMPQAHLYYSDALAAYQDLAFDFGIHFPMRDKSQTYSVEADNAELRHRLAWPAWRAIHAAFRAVSMRYGLLFGFSSTVGTVANSTSCPLLTRLISLSSSALAVRHL